MDFDKSINELNFKYSNAEIRERSLVTAGGGLWKRGGDIEFECKQLEEGGPGAKFQCIAPEGGGTKLQCTDIWVPSTSDWKQSLVVLRSAVGKTHVLRSDLWWTIPFHILHWSSWDTFKIPTDQVALARHSGVQEPVISRHGITWSFLDQSANQDWYLPVPTYGSTWVVLWLLFCRSAPSTFPVTWSTLKGPAFRGVPSHRLYSEIDHIHLSSEAQCVSHHLSPVDCHNGSN